MGEECDSLPCRPRLVAPRSRRLARLAEGDAFSPLRSTRMRGDHNVLGGDRCTRQLFISADAVDRPPLLVGSVDAQNIAAPSQPVSAARVVCGSQPVEAMSSPSVAPMSRWISSMTWAIFVPARGEETPGSALAATAAPAVHPSLVGFVAIT
jgi:hypothetical protein